jgi:hypothetical protein
VCLTNGKGEFTFFCWKEFTPPKTIFFPHVSCSMIKHSNRGLDWKWIIKHFFGREPQMFAPVNWLVLRAFITLATHYRPFYKRATLSKQQRCNSHFVAKHIILYTHCQSDYVLICNNFAQFMWKLFSQQHRLKFCLNNE